MISRFRDPADRAESYSVTLTALPLPAETVAAARQYVAREARDEDDLALLLDALGLVEQAP
ncbi:hypothetical protein ABT093_09955 [Kitasatospora sp. NPDC002551]|uniref:hypothetical protein n=1 Tax=Kitasatospora sp. NPDC002551 TaxID=3154539 RepID=UPI003320BE64